MEDTSQVPQSEPACRGMPKLRSGRAAESHPQGADAPAGPSLPSSVQALPRQPLSAKLPQGPSPPRARAQATRARARPTRPSMHGRCGSTPLAFPLRPMHQEVLNHVPNPWFRGQHLTVLARAPR